MTSLGFGCSALVRATMVLIVIESAYAAGPLDNRWLDFSKDNSHFGAGLEPLDISNSDTETDLAWADLDRNGYVDVVIVRKQPWTTTGKRTNLLLMNYAGVLEDRTMQFASRSDIPEDMGFLTPTNDRDVIIHDINGNGWLDMITVTTLSDGDPKHIGHPRIYMNLGFDGQQQWRGLEHQDARIPQLYNFDTGQPQNPRFNAVACGDVTGDGYPDLFFADHDSSSAPGGFQQLPNQDLNHRLLVNNGGGYFDDLTQIYMFPSHVDSSYSSSAVIADLNLDGANDIVFDSKYEQPWKVQFLYNHPSSNYFTWHDDGGLAAADHVSVADLDQDGRPDRIDSGDGFDLYFLNTGIDAAGRVIWSSGNKFSYAGSCDGCYDNEFSGNNLVIDIDQDGWDDVLITDVETDWPGYCSQRRLHIYRNTGTNPGGPITLQEEQELLVYNQGWKSAYGMYFDDLKCAHDVAVFDIDNDGDNDMLLSRRDGTDIWINQEIICQQDLGAASPSGPVLSMCGEGLGTGESSQLSLSGAAASVPAYVLMSSPGGANITLAGGSLVSVSNLLAGFPIQVTTTPQGAFSFTIPGGYSNLELIVQVVVADPHNYAVSNAIHAKW